MSKKIVTGTLITALALSCLSVSGNVLAANVSQNQAQISTVSQGKTDDIIQFKDPMVKKAAKLSLTLTLGRPVTDKDLTQVNLNKIKALFIGLTQFDSEPQTLEDLYHMPNINTLQIAFGKGNIILDSTPIATLHNLTSFQFTATTDANGGFSSFKPLESTKLQKLQIDYAKLPVDQSETSLGNIKTLSDVTISNKDNDTNSYDFGRLDNLPNLQGLYLSGINLSQIPTLASSQNLTDLTLSGGNISQIPDYTTLKKLASLDVSGNNISSAEGLVKYNKLALPPYIGLDQNILTNDNYIKDYKGTVRTQDNFIAGYNLFDQSNLKPVDQQTVKQNDSLTVPINWAYEDGSQPSSYSKNQLNFMNLNNANISVDNDNLMVTKDSVNNTLQIKGIKQGMTQVTLSYKDNVKTTFSINVQ